ncbi:hypothetical protein [Salinibacterium sp. TMP30]|uniref:hypothetical protein n=1 Tax=Salinibacterium sp. TMP30 TaxID=3138237 RepID=UPI003138A134
MMCTFVVDEMSDAKRFPTVLGDLLGDHAEAVNGLFERFEHARAVDAPNRYEAAGFTVHGSILVASGRPAVTTMWRDPTPCR